MTNTHQRVIVSLLAIAALLTLSGCYYSFALSPNQGRPLDNALIGVWQNQSGQKLAISRKNRTEYSVVFYGEDNSSYSAYPINVGTQTLLQVITHDKDDRPYRLVSYSVRANRLTIQYVDHPSSDPSDVRKAIVENRPGLYKDVGVFTKTNESFTPLMPDSFSAKGLNNEKTLTNLYLGKFDEIPFKRTASGFGVLFGEYLTSYAQQCAAYLPANKVEITEQKCATERVTRNGWGVEISRSCVEWVSVGTGRYADPKLYETKLMLDKFQTLQGLRTFIEVFTNPEKALGDTLGLVGNILDARVDMNKLVRMNSCSSPGLKRFEENMNRFANNGQPIILAPPPTIANFSNTGFPLPPLITGSWGMATANTSEILLNQFERSDAPASVKAVARRITRFRVKQLAFYPGATLCEGLAAGGSSTITFIALSDGTITLLNGKSAPIHELNKKVPLAINTKVQAEEYFRFFFSAVFGEEGSFRIIEGEDNISWADGATAVDSQKVVNHLQPLVVTRLRDRRWKGSATVQYGVTVFNIVFYAKPTGEMEMAEDKPIATDLPLRREKYDGYLRREMN